MRRFRTYHEVEHETGSGLLEQVLAQRERLARRLAQVRAVVAVASGKGGVGKSAITANLAAVLAQRGARVGALDADLNGPSLGRMLDVTGARLAATVEGIQPATSAAGVCVMSMDLLQQEVMPLRWRAPQGDGFVWRGLAESGTLREFLADVTWGELDYLLIDMPPGTDRIERLLDLVPDPQQVLLITTPAEITRFVVAKSAQLLHDARVGCKGMVANMIAPDTEFAAESGIDLWAAIPFDPALGAATDRGVPYAVTSPDAPASRAIMQLADRVECERGGRLAP
jgi:ATP-binding protein involved in chromosome partitioning